MKNTILIVDDEKNTREGLGKALKRDYDIFLAESAKAAAKILSENQVDIMLSDVKMPGEDGLTLLKAVKKRYPKVICILLTAYGNVETAVEAMKLGADDFLTKPVNLDHLDILLERSIHQRNLKSENEELRKQLNSKFGLENIIGNSPAMEKVFDIITQAAPTQATVLIQGDSGTGKELVAAAIHKLSTRNNGPFVPVHCAALSSSLLESELFGHEKGAFTGAVSQHKGRFEMANGGTLFLDEISEIDHTVQVKLLRVLEERKFERVGGHETVDVDIRIIAATNRNLKKYVDEGKFREDLYYRLDVVNIKLPSLKERESDIVMLSSHFITEFATRNNKNVVGITPEAIDILQSYNWPGNVRELRNTIEKMVVLSKTETLNVNDIPANIKEYFSTTQHSALPTNKTETFSSTESLAETEKRKIVATIKAAKGNLSDAANTLGISRRTLYRKLHNWKAEQANDDKFAK